MKTINVMLFLALIFGYTNTNAQLFNSEKAVTHFYIVNVDKNLLGLSNSTNVGDENKEIEEIRSDLLTNIIDSIYTLSSEMFKTEIGLELLPLGELKNKIAYNANFPKCPDMVNIKKVLKKASGYKYYADYYVNIFSGFNGEYLAKPHFAQIKPLYAICFTLYDNTGRIVKKIDFSYKSKVPFGNNKKGSVKTNQEVQTRLCDMYCDAFKEFAQEYKRVLVAKL